MKNLTKFTILIMALPAIPFTASAESWSCRHGNDVREIHITHETSAPVPCSVVYKKLTEGVEDQVLWSASSDVNYCEEKANAFVEKQIGWGWTCVETISDEDHAEESAANDSATSENATSKSTTTESTTSESTASESAPNEPTTEAAGTATTPAAETSTATDSAAKPAE